jgi:hypothetical protein
VKEILSFLLWKQTYYLTSKYVMNETYIKLYRKLLKNPIASNLELLGFFTNLLLRASFEEHSFYL